MRTLVFFIGPAGAGKTTIAKKLAARRKAAFFDMDTMLRPAAEAIMRAAGLDPNDRDSAEYKALCRDLGYRITMDAALENLQLGNDAYVVGPFTKETDDQRWLERELWRIGAGTGDTSVKAVYVHLAGKGIYRERIEKRALESDAWKLANWEAFSRSLRPREIKWPIPAGAILYYDNSGPFTEADAGLLERFIDG